MEDVADFYGRLAEVAILVLGFWLAVAQLRPPTGPATGPATARRAAHSVAVQLALPAAMSLVALADDGRGVVWRTAFLVGAAWGVGMLVLLRPDAGTPRVVAAMQWSTLGLYALVALVALVPGRAFGYLRLPITPLQAEAGLFGLLVFVALNQAFWLVFPPDPADRAGRAGPGTR